MVLKAVVIFTFKEALLCIPPFFYSVAPLTLKASTSAWNEIFSLSLSLSGGGLSRNFVECILVYSYAPIVDAHRIPSVLAMRPSAYLDHKPLILPFLFLPPFPSQSRRFISTLIRCAPSRCTLESVRFSLPPSRTVTLSTLSKLFSTDCPILPFVFDDYRLVFPLSL